MDVGARRLECSRIYTYIHVTVWLQANDKITVISFLYKCIFVSFVGHSLTGTFRPLAREGKNKAYLLFYHARSQLETLYTDYTRIVFYNLNLCKDI